MKGSLENKYDEKRSSAWTDRILYVENGLNCVDYNCEPHLVASDHRPVYATFEVALDHIEPQFQQPTNAPSVSGLQGHATSSLKEEGSERDHPHFTSESEVCTIM